MPSRLSTSPKLGEEPSPIAETQVVLTALERLNQDKRITVLSAAIAFYKIGNGELNVVK